MFVQISFLFEIDLILFMYIISLCVCVCTHTDTKASVWRSVDNIQETVLSYYMLPKEGTQVARLGFQQICPQHDLAFYEMSPLLAMVIILSGGI